MKTNEEALIVDNRHMDIYNIISVYCARNRIGFKAFRNKNGGWSLYKRFRGSCEIIK